MKIETVTITHTCDVCGEEKKILENVKLNLPSYIEQSYVYFSPKVYIPYGTTDGDICEQCFKEALKRYIL